MRIIAFIEDYRIVKKILDYLGVYEFGKKRSSPRTNTYPDEPRDYIRGEYCAKLIVRLQDIWLP